MIHSSDTLRALAQGVLSDSSRKWTVQGLGMLRTYLTKNVRLHIWDSALRYKPNPSKIHNHPWDFVSTVVCGEIANLTFSPIDVQSHKAVTDWYEKVVIRCGPDPSIEPKYTGELTSLERKINLIQEGCSYYMNAGDYHSTRFLDGTVTVVSRNPRPAHNDMAEIYIPSGAKWVSAEPRDATKDEIDIAVQSALSRLRRGRMGGTR